MPFHADVIVVGSGPSGVSAALPMLEAGMAVLLLDGGAEPAAGAQPEGSYHDLRRREAEQWRLFLGAKLEALRVDRPPSPKFESPGSRFAFEGFAESQRISGEGFTVVGSLARGGLSTIWGAGLATYDDGDLVGFPLTTSDLADSYRRVSRRMGVTGFSDDALATPVDSAIVSQPELPLAEITSRMLRRYDHDREQMLALGLSLGRARSAVLTAPVCDRRPCELCDMCLWGCRLGSVWSAAHDLEVLRGSSNFEYRPGHLADTLTTVPGGYRVEGRVRDPTSHRGTFAFDAPMLVLAAGAFTTTRLVLELQGRFDEAVPLLGTPAAAFALCLPGWMGATVANRGFSLAQLSFMAQGPGSGGTARAYGNLFTATGLPAAPIIERMPVSRLTAVRLYRSLQPALVLGNCFLSSSYSDNNVRLERRGGGPSWLVVTGSSSPALAERFRLLKKQLARGFRRLGAFLLPGSFVSAGPGDDLRYGGTIPMNASPARGQVDRFGELHEFPRLYVVDLSCFPGLSAKPPVLSMMANADRIGREIAARWRRGRG